MINPVTVETDEATAKNLGKREKWILCEKLLSTVGKKTASVVGDQGDENVTKRRQSQTYWGVKVGQQETMAGVSKIEGTEDGLKHFLIKGYKKTLHRKHQVWGAGEGTSGKSPHGRQDKARLSGEKPKKGKTDLHLE